MFFEPNNLFSIIGIVSICEPAPELPTTRPLAHHVLPRADAGGCPRNADARRLVDRTEPAELARIEARGGKAVERGVGHARMHHADDGAVLRRVVVEVVRRAQAPRARHVLHRDARLPGNVRGEIRRKSIRVTRITAARIRAHDERHRPALVELLRRRRPTRPMVQARAPRLPRTTAIPARFQKNRVVAMRVPPAAPQSWMSIRMPSQSASRW